MLLPFCKLASKPPAIFMSPVKYASSRATSCAFSSTQTTPASFCASFSTSLCGLNSGLGSKSKTSTSCPRKRSRRGFTNGHARRKASSPGSSPSLSFPSSLAFSSFASFFAARFWFSSMRFFFRFRSRVVLFELVEGLLVVVNLFEKSFQVRQFHLRLDREIKHALDHRPIDRRARNFNVVFVAPPVQLDFMRQLHAIHGAVVVVQDFVLHAADGRRLLCDQVRLRIKKYLPLHAGSCGHFELRGVLPAHLRVSHKGQCDFAFLEVEQPRVVILRRRFQLHSFRTSQRPKLAGRTLMPRRLPAVRFDQVLFAHQQFRVVAVRQLGIQRVRPALPVIRL